jgi:predicted phosphodiesterase
VTNQKSNLNWLHISDLHFRSGRSYDRDLVLRAFLRSLPQLVERFGKVQLIFVTGDIAYSGKADEYTEATKFFDKLLEATEITRRQLVMVPGNHDVDRSTAKGLSRTLDSRDEAYEFFDLKRPLLHVSQKQRAFAEWYNKYFAGIRTFPEVSTCGVSDVSVGTQKITVLTINTAAFAIGDDDSGKLLIGRPCLDEALEQFECDKDALRIAICHHPLSWLSPLESESIVNALQKSADCILTGHLHLTDASRVEGLTGTAVYLSAGALYQTSARPNRAMFANVAERKLRIHPIRFEDGPEPVWGLDPSIYPHEPNYCREYPLRCGSGAELAGAEKASPTPNRSQTVGQQRDSSTSAVVSIATVQTLKAEFEQDLFCTPSRDLLYAPPRIISQPQDFNALDTVENAITVEEICASGASYFIETKPEYGGTILCKRLAYEFALAGTPLVFRKDARTLPNYRKKLEASFPPEAQISDGRAILILDHLDLERDERLLRELAHTKWFSRLIAVYVNRDVRASTFAAPANLPFEFVHLYLWNIRRGDVRSLAATLFKSQDDPFISTIVDKVYADLLGLCIPLTPANVIMYLRILHREGEFHPLNRVDIVGRYLLEVLRRPSDSYTDCFNSKNKLDVLSAFCHQLYTEQKAEFDDRYWHEFASGYQKKTLSEFDAATFLHELVEARVLVRYGSRIFLKYHFFFSFFLGRHIASRPALLEKFLSEQEHLRIRGVVDVITGLSSDNGIVVQMLTSQLESHLEAFSRKYIPQNRDPLLDWKWPDSTSDEEHVWGPIAKQLEAAPRPVGEIDLIKSSMLSEIRTADQQVRFQKFIELETALFATSSKLGDALRNSDDIEGELKLHALEALLKAEFVALQIGTVFAPVIAEKRVFVWGGIAFLDFHTVKEYTRLNSNTPELSAAVVERLADAIARKAAEQVGIKKLGPVFRAREKGSSKVGFLELGNFNCILSAKAQGWDEAIAAAIEKTDKNAYYLLMMLNSLMDEIENEISTTRDTAHLKRLVALIQAKRNFGKQAPGSKAVTRMLAHLEKTDHFQKKRAREADTGSDKPRSA